MNLRADRDACRLRCPLLDPSLQRFKPLRWHRVVLQQDELPEHHRSQSETCDARAAAHVEVTAEGFRTQEGGMAGETFTWTLYSRHFGWKAPPIPSAYPSKLVRRWAERKCLRPIFEFACLEHCYATIFAKQMLATYRCSNVPDLRVSNI